LSRNIRRATRKHHSAEEKIRIVLDGLRGETSIAESMYYSWSKEFLEAGKRRLAGDTARAATNWDRYRCYLPAIQRVLTGVSSAAACAVVPLRS
jgi:transposase